MQRRVSNRPNLPIVALPDPQLGREKAAALLRTWAILRTLGPLTVLPAKTTEAELLAYLEANPAKLVLLPWNRYLEWTRIEGHFGISRSSGPTCAGYFASPVDSRELGAINDYHRLILLDFHGTSFSERWRLVRSLLHEELRAGIQPLLHDKALIYSKEWMGSEGPGPALDSILGLEALQQAPWKERIQPIQLLALTLWNLAYEQGRTLMRGGWLTQLHAHRVRAHLEIGMDSELLALRLCYHQQPNAPRSVLREFWPDAQRSEDFRQHLARHADFVRVHPVPERDEIEIVATLLKSSPARNHPDDLRSIWIEPLSSRLITEIPGKPASETLARRYRELLPQVAPSVEQAQARILWLERELAAKERKISELTDGVPDVDKAS